MTRWTVFVCVAMLFAARQTAAAESDEVVKSRAMTYIASLLKDPSTPNLTPCTL